MKIKLMLVIALVTLMSVFMSGCGSETKLGYLDAERVMNEAPQIKTIRDNIDAKNKEIEAKETDLMSKKATMSDEEFKKAQMDIQRQYQGLDMQYKSQVKIQWIRYCRSINRKRIICCSAKNISAFKWYASSKTRVCSSRRN